MMGLTIYNIMTNKQLYLLSYPAKKSLLPKNQEWKPEYNLHIE